MNYLKAALAGFGMSFIGTSLCASKVAQSQYDSYKWKIKNNIYKKLFFVVEKESIYQKYSFVVEKELIWEASFDSDLYKSLYQKYNLGIPGDNLSFSSFKYDEYYNANLKASEKNFWFNKSGWSVTHAFLINNAWCIPTSLLGALFHDKVGRDLTPKINEYFGSEISPYLVTGGLFGGIFTSLIISPSAVICCINRRIKGKTAELTKPWIYSIFLIQGFLVGATAMAGAYFGDEEPVDSMTDELTTQEVESQPSI